jgi:hypothetical protein
MSEHYIPFLSILAAKGVLDSPVPFLEEFMSKLPTLDPRLKTCQNLSRDLSTQPERAVRRIAKLVEFGAAFVVRD